MDTPRRRRRIVAGPKIPSFSASRRTSLGRLAAIGFIVTAAGAEEILVRRQQKAGSAPDGTASSAPLLYSGVRAQLVATFEGPDWRRANVPLEIRWEREGGDWSDAAGTQWGNAPFASATMNGYASPALTFDAKSLVQELLTDNTGIMLRSSVGMKLASSRTAGQPAPVLVVNGVVCPLLADTWIDGSGGNLGRLDWLQTPALLKFDLSAVTLPVQSASLSVLVTNTYSPLPITVDAFYLEMPVIVTDPGAQLGGAQQGIAATVAIDQALATHPSVIRYSEMKSHDDVYKAPASGYNTGDWWVGTRPDIYGKTGGDWGYDVSYVPVPEYGVTIGRSCIPGAPNQGSVSGINMHRFAVTGLDSPVKDYQHPPGEGEDELHLRYLLCLDPDVFDGIRPDGGVKLPGLTGSFDQYIPAPAAWVPDRSAWSYRLEHGNPSPAHPGLFRPFVYAYDFTAPIGTGSGEPVYFGSNICFKVGLVYSVEQYVKLNTQNIDGTWNADGIIRMWVDGVLVLDVPNRMIRQDAKMHFYDIPFWCLYHGGTIAPNKDIHYSMGACVVAHEYIGPPRKVAQTGIILPAKPPPKPPKPAGGRPSWAAKAPANTWIEIPNTRVDLADIAGRAAHPNPGTSGFSCYYEANFNLLSPWTGPSFQQKGAVLHTGPSGGHADGWSNHKLRTVLNTETPYTEWMCDASPGTMWYCNSSFNADFKPCCVHTFYNHQFIDQRGWDTVWASGGVGYSTGSPPLPPPDFQWGIDPGPEYDHNTDTWANTGNNKMDPKYIAMYAQVSTFDTNSRMWLPIGTIPQVPFTNGTLYPTPSAVNPFTGDVYHGRDGSTLARWVKWNCATNQHEILPIQSYPKNFLTMIDATHNTIVQVGTKSQQGCLFDMISGAYRPMELVGAPDDLQEFLWAQYPAMAPWPNEPGNFLYAGNPYYLYTQGQVDSDPCVFYKLTRLDNTRYQVDKVNTTNPPKFNLPWTNGLHTKLFYSDELGGFVIHNRWNESVKFMRVI